MSKRYEPATTDSAQLTPAHLRAYMRRLDAEAERTFALCPWLRGVLEERLRERAEREAREQAAAD